MALCGKIYMKSLNIYDERYSDWDNAEDKLSFTTEVLYVLYTMFGE